MPRAKKYTEFCFAVTVVTANPELPELVKRSIEQMLSRESIDAMSLDFMDVGVEPISVEHDRAIETVATEIDPKNYPPTAWPLVRQIQKRIRELASRIG